MGTITVPVSQTIGNTDVYAAGGTNKKEVLIITVEMIIYSEDYQHWHLHCAPLVSGKPQLPED